MELLLLPGMDGTGKLFAPFLKQLPSHLRPRVVAYPRDRVLTYSQLLKEIEIPDAPFAIIAESFSGPIAIQLAARSREAQALVLIASFARMPTALLAPLCRLMGGSWLFRIGIPFFAMRFLLLGPDAGHAEEAEVRAVLGSVRPAVLAGRLREVASVDVRADFARLEIPKIYIAGRRDRLLGTAAVKELAILRPDMKTVFLHAPHLVLQTRPAEVNDG